MSEPTKHMNKHELVESDTLLLYIMPLHATCRDKYYMILPKTL